MGKPALGDQGGTAYDPRHQSTWIAYGNTIEEVRLGGCTPMLKFTPSLLNAKAKVTGLAISDRHRILYHLETAIGYAGIRAYDMRIIPPKPLTGGLSVMLPNMGNTAGGLAYDEVYDRLFMSASYGAFFGFMSDLYVIKPGGVMTTVRSIPLPMVAGPGGPQIVTGLGFDAATRNLYATDGNLTISGTLANPDTGNVGWGKTGYSNNLTGYYAGLAVIPGWAKRAVGTSCLGTPCPNCTSMTTTTMGGDPALGNENFGFMLTNGPQGSSGFLILGGGLCTSGLQISGLCGPLYPAFAPAPIMVGPIPISGQSTCTGTGLVSLPIPVNQVLCGVDFCAQWVLFCQTTTGLGVGITMAVEFDITGS